MKFVDDDDDDYDYRPRKDERLILVHVAYTVAPVTSVDRKRRQRYPLFRHGINFSNSGLQGSSSCALSVLRSSVCTLFSPRCMQCRRAACNADAYTDEKAVSPSVCMSVRPSVKRVDCDKTEDRSVQIFIPYERSFRVLF